jgi:5-methyltetrahydrofolate--homocysteine methyltransferase
VTFDDFDDLEGCNEILDETRPGLIEIHHVHFETGRTQSRRNTFGCNLVNLGDHDIAHENREGSIAAMTLASRRRSGDDVDFPGREALQRLFGGAGPLPVSATLGRVKDAFRYGRSARDRP